MRPPRRGVSLFAIDLACVALTVRKHGIPYATTQARSMVAGAIAFLVFALIVSQIQMRYKTKALLASSALLSHSCPPLRRLAQEIITARN